MKSARQIVKSSQNIPPESTIGFNHFPVTNALVTERL